MRDLFGEVAVTLREIQIWLFKVPRLPHYASRRASYVRQWNVHSKIARAKAAGELDSIFGDESCEFCGQTLCREQTYDLPADPSAELMLLRRRVRVLEVLMRPGKEKPGLVSRALP